MEVDLSQRAVSAALSGDWKLALSLNEAIIKENPNDTDALNRLARAYAELGKIKKAKIICEKVLKIDPFNSIALKSQLKWRGLKNGASLPSQGTSAEEFLEEPGKTKIATLLYLGDAKVIAKLDCGDEVKISTHGRRVAIITKEGNYIGRLADDLSARIRKLVALGNEYKVLIKSIQPDQIKIFIRETKRAINLLDTPSFPTEKIEYVSFTPPELVHRKESISLQEEE